MLHVLTSTVLGILLFKSTFLSKYLNDKFSNRDLFLVIAKLNHVLVT